MNNRKIDSSLSLKEIVGSDILDKFDNELENWLLALREQTQVDANISLENTYLNQFLFFSSDAEYLEKGEQDRSMSSKRFERR